MSEQIFLWGQNNLKIKKFFWEKLTALGAKGLGPLSKSPSSQQIISKLRLQDRKILSF